MTIYFLIEMLHDASFLFVQSKPQRDSQKKSGKRIHLDWNVKKPFVFLGWDVKMSFVFLDQDVKKSFVFLDWDVKRRGRISLPLARRLPTPCSSNKRPDNLFLHSLVYWSSLGRPRHLNKYTNTRKTLSCQVIIYSSFQSDPGICRDRAHRSGEN